MHKLVVGWIRPICSEIVFMHPTRRYFSMTLTASAIR